MIDRDSLEWYVDIDCDMMTVSDFAELVGRLGDIGYTDRVPRGRYDIGFDERSEVEIHYESKRISLYLNEIGDSDMPEVMGILTSFRGLRIKEMFHECLSRRFCKRFSDGLYEPQMLDEYAMALKETKYDHAKVWEAWCEESGFNDWCREVYEE